MYRSATLLLSINSMQQLQEIQEQGIAGQDGQLMEGDQILAIDGQVGGQSWGSVMTTTRRCWTVTSRTSKPSGSCNKPEAGWTWWWRGARRCSVPRIPSSPATGARSGTRLALEILVPMACFSKVEVIDLVNDGTGLGFGIIGGQQTGVVVKTILPGGVADRDSRLLPGDFILQVD